MKINIKNINKIFTLCLLIIIAFCFSCEHNKNCESSIKTESVCETTSEIMQTTNKNIEDIDETTISESIEHEEKKQFKSITHNFGKMFLIGDSNFDKNFNLNVGHKFFYEFFEPNEYDSFTNLAKEGAGLTVGWRYENSDNWKLPPHYISIEFVDSDTNILILYTSFNDVYSNGDMGDKTNTLPNTVYGSLNFINGRIKEKLPNTMVIFVSPMKWPILENDAEKKELCEKYVSIIESYANENGYLYIDLYHDSLNELDEFNYMYDHIHVNEMTQRDFVLPRIKGFLYRCCMK